IWRALPKICGSPSAVPVANSVFRCRWNPSAMTNSEAATVSVELPEGHVLPVLTAPDPVLATAAEQSYPTDPAVVQLCADLVVLLLVSPGCVGLVAQQVGVVERAFCVDVTGHPEARTLHGLIVLVNAEVVAASRNEKGREGCMSVPDFTGDVKRASRITVRG